MCDQPKRPLPLDVPHRMNREQYESAVLRWRSWARTKLGIRDGDEMPDGQMLELIASSKRLVELLREHAEARSLIIEERHAAIGKAAYLQALLDVFADATGGAG